MRKFLTHAVSLALLLGVAAPLSSAQQPTSKVRQANVPEMIRAFGFWK